MLAFFWDYLYDIGMVFVWYLCDICIIFVSFCMILGVFNLMGFGVGFFLGLFAWYLDDTWYLDDICVIFA